MNNHAPGGIRTRNPNKRGTVDKRLRPRGHRDRHTLNTMHYNIKKTTLCQYYNLLLFGTEHYNFTDNKIFSH